VQSQLRIFPSSFINGNLISYDCDYVLTAV
jgi:hypothetical protein